MGDKTTYYQKNKEKLLNQAKVFYENNKETLQKQTRNKLCNEKKYKERIWKR